MLSDKWLSRYGLLENFDTRERYTRGDYSRSLHLRKPDFCLCEKTQISFTVTAKLISAFVFAIQIVQSLYFFNLKFQASSHFLWLYSLVCVGPGRRPVFSERGSFRAVELKTANPNTHIHHPWFAEKNNIWF